MRVLAIALASTMLFGCATYREQLIKSQASFERNEHERTLATLRNLEPDVTKLALPEQAQYCYLRGMTDYRIGFRADARHWLALAKAFDDNSPGVLPTDWKARASEALDDLNGQVWSDGIASLAVVRRGDDESPKKK
jgi:hypothetical protein